MEDISKITKSENKIKKFFLKFLRVPELGLILFIILFGTLVALINPQFIQFINLLQIFRTTVLIFIIGCGMTFVLVGGEIDLSVGSVFGFTGTVIGFAMVFGLSIPAAIGIGIITGIIIGSITGQIIVRLKIPALIVTLGMLYIYRGLIARLTHGESLFSFPLSFYELARGTIFGVPYIIIIAVIIGLISHVILNNTSFGYNVRCVGGNKLAAIAGGINVNKIKMILFIITGIACAISSVLSVSYYRVVSLNLGYGFEMYVIAAVIIGGTSLYGGTGNILGTFLGSLIVMLIQNGMILLRVSAYWQKVVVGVVMIVAVGIDIARRRLMIKAN